MTRFEFTASQLAEGVVSPAIRGISSFRDNPRWLQLSHSSVFHVLSNFYRKQFITQRVNIALNSVRYFSPAQNSQHLRRAFHR